MAAEEAEAPDKTNGDRDKLARERAAAKRAAREAERRTREAAEVERLIAEKEGELGDVGSTINDPDFYQTHPNPQAVFSQFAKLKDEIESLYAKLDRLERQAPEAAAS